MKHILMFILVFLITVLWGCGKTFAFKDVREGDIVFQTSRSSQSKAIQLATHSRYSHMGIILFNDGKPFVFEAVEPVRYTPLNEWVKRGENGHAVLKRLKRADSLLSSAALGRMHALASEYEGKHYDAAFAWDDSRMYCSELVWKLCDRVLGIRVGRLQTMKEFDVSSPVVRKKLGERYGSRIPLDETVITPQAMFESEELITVQTVD